MLQSRSKSDGPQLVLQILSLSFTFQRQLRLKLFRQRARLGSNFVMLFLLCLLILTHFSMHYTGWRAPQSQIVGTAAKASGRLAPLLAGRAMVRDINSGIPSLASDRLIIDLTDAPPATNGDFYAYLLQGATGAGVMCGPLSLNNNALQSNCDFPGRNLIATYDTFSLQQESPVFNATLPPDALGHLRKVLVQATDTPNQVGYGVGLVQQARILHEHAGYTQESAAAADFIGAKQHIEHALNTLYGKSDPRYGDIDNDGIPSNPGDTYGLLVYTHKVSETLQAAANASDATPNIKTRVTEVRTALGNLGNGADGRWLAIFIEKANLALQATTTNDLVLYTSQMAAAANRALNGEELNDNGQIEPAEGGAVTAHAYAQRAADYLSSTVGGYVRYGASAAALQNDQLIINLPSVTAAAGEQLWIYLGLANGERAALGAVTATGGAVNATFTAAGRDLLAQYQSLYLAKGVKYAEAALPPAPLAPVRQVLVQATDTPGQVGYGVGLVQQARILFEHAGYARDSAQSQSLTEMKQHIEHALNTLYGKADLRYGDIDQDGIPSDPSDGYGLLVYTRKMSETLQLTVNHAAATANMKSRATQVRTTLNNLGNGADGGWLALFHERAKLALAATTANDALVYTNQMVGIASRILNGEDLNDNGQIEPVTGEGSAQTAYLYSQYVADYDPQALVTPPTSTPTATQPPMSPTPTATSGTPVPTGGDAYEADDQCAAAQTISSDGRFQTRTFHKQADNDWVRLDTTAGTTYIIEARVPPNAPTDVVLEIHPSCNAAATSTQNYSFSPDVRLRITASESGSYFLKLLNDQPGVFGDQVTYQLSVSAFQSTAPQTGALIIVAGRNAEGDPLQTQIHNVTNRVYRLWRNNGYAAENIRYLAPDLSLDADLDGKSDVTGLPNKANLQDAIVNWARTIVSADRALTLYIMDHGAYDKIYLDEPRSERLLPQDLHAWLNQLESAVPGVKVNIVIEACNSGSFIDPAQSISKAGRVVITSAGAFSLAWASPTGAAFSDAFLDALATGQNLYLAFDEARTNAQRRHNDQAAWLDDDGDGVPNDGQDGTLAAARGFNNPNSFDSSKDGQWKPYVVAAEVRSVAAHQHAGAAATRVRGEIWAEVRDNSGVKTVLATIYPPSYQPPTTSEALVIGPPPITLQARGNDMYAGLYGAFEEMGTYRIVISAIDDDNLESRVLEFNFSTGSRILLPIISR